MPFSITNLLALLGSPKHRGTLHDLKLGRREHTGAFLEIGQYFLALIRCLPRLCQENDDLTRLLNLLEDSARYCINDERTENFVKFLDDTVSFAQQLKGFFLVANPTPQLLSELLNFLSLAVEELQNHGSHLISLFDDLIRNLGEELRHLSSVVCDTPCDVTKLIPDIKSVAHEAGSFLYFFFLTGELPISQLREKSGRLKENIKQQCHEISTMSTLASFFVLESLLDELLRGDGNDELETLHEELMFWRPFIQGVHGQQHMELVIQIRDETEYMIWWYSVRAKPIWHLSRIINKIALIKNTLNILPKIRRKINSRSPAPCALDHLLSLLECQDLSLLVQNARFSGIKVKTFQWEWRGSLISTVLQYIRKLYPNCNKLEDLNDLLVCFVGYSKFATKDPAGVYRPQSSSSMDLFRLLIAMIMSFVQEELWESFRVPEFPPPNILELNKALAIFLDFLVDTTEVLLKHKPDGLSAVNSKIKILQEELKHLITILGDSPFSCGCHESTKEILKHIGGFANDAASYLYFMLFKDEITMERIDLAYSFLLEVRLDVMNKKIEDHCLTVSKIQCGKICNSVLVSPSIVDSLLDELEELIHHEAGLVLYAPDQVRDLRNEIQSSSLILKKLECQQHAETELHQLVNLAYEAEYIIKSLAVKDAPIRYIKLRIPHVIAQIKLITGKIEEAGKLAMYPHAKVSSNAETTLEVPETIVGLSNEVEALVEQLVGEPSHKQVTVSITGMAGLGKTVLARKLYNDRRVRDHFDKFAWCEVSKTCHKRKILIDIMSSLTDVNREQLLIMDDGNLLEMIRKTLLQAQRYLIVLDDVCGVPPFDDWRNCLPRNSGSRILLTTQSKEVAQEAESYSIHELRFLSEAESWDLLQLQLKEFHKQPFPQELVDIGMQIAEQCHGLPLAVIVIAAVLANTEKKENLWHDVLKRLNSHILEGPENRRNILEVSYERLPPHLKPCFLYLGFFPKGMEISTRKLISLWISEGFIQKEKHKSLKDVADVYLQDLINRSLVLIVRKRSDGGAKACKVHDLVLDLCLIRAKEENFLKLIGNKFWAYEQHHRLCVDHSISSYSSPCLLPSYSRPSGLHFHSCYSRPFGQHIRSFSNPYPVFVSHKLKLLRVLDTPKVELNDCDIEGTRAFVYLRYLTLSCLPSSISHLHNLEFLLVKNKLAVEITESLLTMEKLRHLHFMGGATFSKSLNGKANLHRITEKNKLESISSVSISDQNDEKILRCLPCLQNLKCQLEIFWDTDRNYHRFPELDSLNRLEILHVSFNQTCNPDEIRFPPNLKKLTSLNFNLSSRGLSIIAQLVNLEVLKLKYNTLERKGWNTREPVGEFKNLKFLELDGVELESWDPSTDDFPQIRRLVLRDCNLDVIPSSFGYMPTLEMIEVLNCDQSVRDSALEIQEQQLEFGNEEFQIITDEGISHRASYVGFGIQTPETEIADMSI